MGRRFSGEELDAALRQLDLPHQPMIGASSEQRQLIVLGLEGVTASPLQLARAYRELLARAPADGVVPRGLRGSVSYGMARAAGVPGIDILGKTGTASDPGEAWTHGWFAGAILNRLVIVVYVPHGDGGTAAELARKFLANFGPEKASPVKSARALLFGVTLLVAGPSSLAASAPETGGRDVSVALFSARTVRS